MFAKLFCYMVSFLILSTTVSSTSPVLSIQNNKFLLDNVYINPNSSAEGILINSRMIQGISDGFDKFPYKDTKKWNATRNTNEFVRNMALWKSYGLNAFTIGLQGGGPSSSTSSQTQKNSAFNSDGSLKIDYLNRLKLVLDEASRLKMIVIVSLFYRSQVKIFQGYPQVLQGTLNVIHWLQDRNYTNIIIEPVNECQFSEFKKVGLSCDQHVTDLIELAQKFKFPSGCSYKGSGSVPSDKVVNASQVILIHGNSMKSNSEYQKQVDAVKKSKSYRGQPIVYNEAGTDASKLTWCVHNKVGYGYYDQSGFQSPPVNWSINTSNKQQFFNEAKRLSTTKN